MAYLRKEYLKVNMVRNSILVLVITASGKKKEITNVHFSFFNYKFPCVICKLKIVSNFNSDLKYLLTYLQFRMLSEVELL